MQPRVIFFISFTLIVLFLVDLYVFRGVRLHVANLNGKWKTLLSWAYWLPSVALVIYLGYLFINSDRIAATGSFRPFYFAFGMALTLLLPKLLYSVFLLVEDVIHAFRWIVRQWSPSAPNADGSEPAITRMQFLSQTGLVLSGLFFSGMIYGIARGRYAFRFVREQIATLGLGSSHSGLRIVHISDTHLGSFAESDAREMKWLVDKVNEEKPDFIFFTGDMVNNFGKEALPWVDFFAGMKARMGKFSVLGNHDYGDYVPWPSAREKEENLKLVEQIHREMGFTLLRNENRIVTADGASIAILGVENWGMGGFAKYGDLNMAKRGTEDADVKILLSHDPTHWEEKVLNKEDIDLTLSGHTHGMQFGVEIGSFKWSPARFRYKRWGGLYTEGKQNLYVNRGFGFIGFPGRVGMPPEITVLDLVAKS